jgi:hypothetical protein
MGKKIYLVKKEFDDIKQCLDSDNTQREVAFQFDRSDQTIRQIKKSFNFQDYQQKFQRRMLPGTVADSGEVWPDDDEDDAEAYSTGGTERYGWVKEILDQQEAMDDRICILTDELQTASEKLDVLHRQFKALEYLINRRIR